VTLLMNGTLYSHMPMRFTGGNGMGGSGITLECPAELMGPTVPESIPVGYQFRGLVPAQKTGRMGATVPGGARGVATGSVLGEAFAAGASAGSVTLSAPLRRGVVRSGSSAGSGAASLASFARGVLNGSISIGSRPTADDAAEATVGKNIVGLDLSVGESLALIVRLLRNRQVTDPATGEMTVFADDDVTPLLSAALWDDADGTVPYTGSGADSRDRLE
jgi:hypothetical protein